MRPGVRWGPVLSLQHGVESWGWFGMPDYKRLVPVLGAVACRKWARVAGVGAGSLCCRRRGWVYGCRWCGGGGGVREPGQTAGSFSVVPRTTSMMEGWSCQWAVVGHMGRLHDGSVLGGGRGH